MTISEEAITGPEAANGLTIARRFSTDGVHPYDQLTWEKRDVIQTNHKSGDVVFEQKGVEFPTTWSENASTIVTTKYFRGALGTKQRETSLKQVIDRVVDTYARAAVDHAYMDEANAAIFSDELKFLLVNQYFAFNSPVWFNVGTTSPQQVSACFILSVDDSMDSILNWYKEEGFIFKGGSGAGLNLSRIRSSKELLKSGGTASGPVSFMRGADASAGTIKSGGATRRAAKMVVLDVDHPDIEEFIETKAREEDKIRALRDAGFDMDLGGRDIVSVQYQNANNSVSVTDEFMRAVEDGKEFGLKARSTGEVIETVDARTLFNKIAEAAWACADPGLHYNDTMNAWHTNANTGKITASNPCSEYLSLDNSSCNLASLNLMKFQKADGTFDVERFADAVEVIFTAMDISIAFADFPTEKIGETTRNFRQLGIGYANLGALLMSKGLAYDSEDGRALAAAITSVMTGTAYRRSTEIAHVVGPYNGYAVNAEPHQRVMRQHSDAARALVEVTGGVPTDYIRDGIIGINLEAHDIAEFGRLQWEQGNYQGTEWGWRNAQASLLAPTGTIGFMMDCDTTGIEPDFSLIKFKKMVGGGFMQFANNQIAPALRSLGYDEKAVETIEAYVIENGHVTDAPGLAAEHYDVFDTAAGQQRQITPQGHVYMMAAVQPLLSGAISKTVNLPESATVEEIADIYMDSWRLGLKATAVYRDLCKVGQPLSDGKAEKKDDTAVIEPEIHVVEKIVEKVVEVPRRERLPRSRTAKITSFKVGDADGYLTIGEFVDGRPGEVFLKMSKQGSTLAGMMDAFSVAVSLGLQFGVPLETFIAKFVNQRFEPAGLTDDPDVRTGQSIIDYVVRRLALDYLPFDVRSIYGIYTTAERTAALDNGGVYAPVEDETVQQDEIGESEHEPVVPVHSVEIHKDLQEARKAAAFQDKPTCSTCGTSDLYVKTGACWNCSGCGNSSGCS
jgi:ribonucleoside-diphosphate reductase alpha chain